MASVITLPGTR